MHHQPHRNRHRNRCRNKTQIHRQGPERTLAEERKSFQQHFGVFVVMSVFFVAVDLLSGWGNFWFYWPILGWGIGLAFHYMKAYVPAFYEEGQEEEEEGLELQDFDRQRERAYEQEPDPRKWNEGDLV